MYAHAQAPVRIGIAGGGTDLPAWTKEHTGYCLSLAIKAYTHAVAIARPDGQVVAAYRERDVSNAATEIANGLIRESALMHGWEDGFEVHTLSELSSRGSGLGVSSSFAVSLAACFRHLSLLRDGGVTNPRWRDGGEGYWRGSCAVDAWTVEINKLRRPIGRQDHMAAAHGGLRLYSFKDDGAMIENSYWDTDAKWVADHLALVKLPDGHDSRAILSGVKTDHALHLAMEAVGFGVAAVKNHSLNALGHALHLGQASKRMIAGASSPYIEMIIGQIMDVAGVHGCKVAGAGGGGHIVVACEPDAVARIAAAVPLEVIKVEADLNGVRSDGWT